MSKSQMSEEIAQIPSSVERLLQDGGPSIRRAAAAISAANPVFLATVARGSSDHACTYLKYVSEILLGLPVASLGPSVASIYGAKLRMAGGVCFAVSQSGQSPDIVAMAKSARYGGALTLALTNNVSSPLANVADHVLDIHAGPELSVAATKTFVTSAVAGLAVLAEVARDDALLAAISSLPQALDRAAQITWPELREGLVGASSLYTLGRGPGFAIAGEAALKFKEVCQLHAECYSSAEVMHGPVSIVGSDFPILALAAGDKAEAGLCAVADVIAGKGAQVFVTSIKSKTATRLDHVRTGHPLTDPLALIVSFYATVERLAVDRGIDPDQPRHLKKVTETR